MNPAESQHLEYKRELSDGLEDEVVGFLNHRDGGRILIGVDDAGAVVGLSNPDGDQLNLENKELMRIFRDLEMVEYLGSGMPRILKAYSREAFRVTENFTRMRFASAEPSVRKMTPETLPKTLPETSGSTSETTPKNTSERLLEILKQQSGIGRSELATQLGITADGVKYHLNQLRDEGRIQHKGSSRGGRGHWEVLK